LDDNSNKISTDKWHKMGYILKVYTDLKLKEEES